MTEDFFRKGSEALSLRATGMKWRQVGAQLNISAGYARSISMRVDRARKIAIATGRNPDLKPHDQPVTQIRGAGPDEWVMSLTVRTRNCLRSDNLLTKEAVRAAFVADGGETLLKTPNFGRKCLREVAQSLGEKIGEKLDPNPAKEITARKYADYLRRRGYRVIEPGS